MCISYTCWCVTVLFILSAEPINMFISPPTHPSVCKPFKIQCQSLTGCCFGYGALKTTEMNRPSLFLPPRSSSYRLLPLLCWTISPLGSSFFLLAVAAGGQRYKCWSGFSSPHRFGPSSSLPVSFALVPSVFLCNSSLCDLPSFQVPYGGKEVAWLKSLLVRCFLLSFPNEFSSHTVCISLVYITLFCESDLNQSEWWFHLNCLHEIWCNLIRCLHVIL